YHGNLFLADFGKRQVMCVQIERDGGSYRALSKEDLFPDPPPDFRPVGIAWSDDGLGMFICDWQHRDVKENVAVGRLWKLTFTGKTTGMARPAWLVPAAMNRPFEATTETLISGLLHPARAVRMVAQRKLAARGPSAIGALNAV